MTSDSSRAPGRDRAPGWDGDPPALDTSVAHQARIYNYLLGGTDNYAADRAAAEKAIDAYPATVFLARANRAFLGRAVRYLAGEAGIRQFLDIGTGLPSAGSTHEAAQAVAPDSRVVYVDYDPVVLAHARDMLPARPAGAVSFIEADLRDIGQLLKQAAGLLDFSQPVAVLLLAILHAVGDADSPHALVTTATGALAPGSYLAISHVAADIEAEAISAARDRVSENSYQRYTWRPRAEVLRFFDGLDLVEPGLVPVERWRPDREPGGSSATWAGVARKP